MARYQIPFAVAYLSRINRSFQGANNGIGKLNLRTSAPPTPIQKGRSHSSHQFKPFIRGNPILDEQAFQHQQDSTDLSRYTLIIQFVEHKNRKKIYVFSKNDSKKIQEKTLYVIPLKYNSS